jgi:hypothetical protein
MSYNLTKLDVEYNEYLMACTFNDAGYIVAQHRRWFHRQRFSFPLHPIVDAAMTLCRPDDWHLLLLEWPHKAESDPFKIAYTRDERAGEADRVTLTTMGKYIARHFSMLPAHYVRDLVALYSPRKSDMYFVHTVEEIVEGVQRGPRSCMSWELSDIDDHPYRVYDPKYGWRLALRRESDGVICGRCLCCEDQQGKRFVRSYKRDRDGGYSHADEQLEAWLKSQGYMHVRTWEGARFAHIAKGYSSFLAPYLDGADQHVAVGIDPDTHDKFLLVVEEDEAEYTCNSTCGEPSDVERLECEHCGDTMHEDDAIYVGYTGDYRICPHCCENEFVYGYGRNGSQYHFHHDDAIEVDGDYYHENYLDDNNIVCDIDGDYQKGDDCIQIDSDGEWYPIHDSRIVCTHTERYALRSECVEIGGTWYHEDDDADLIAQAQSKAEPLEETSIDE